MTHEVVVIGAGPAGCAVARRLSVAGHDVALVGSHSRRGWEGVSQRACALLAEEGIAAERPLIEGQLARRGFWSQRSVEGREWLVERSQLAAALRALFPAEAPVRRLRRDDRRRRGRAGNPWIPATLSALTVAGFALGLVAGRALSSPARPVAITTSR